MLCFRWKTKINFLFGSSHDERSDQYMELFGDVTLFFEFLILILRVCIDSFFNLVKKISIIENVRHDEV